MKLYVNTKKMTFDEDNIEHDIVLSVHEKKGKFPVDFEINSKLEDVKVVEDGEARYIVREQNTWNSFPLYEITDNKFVKFDYTKYSYFMGTDRRKVLARKINHTYNPSSEAKTLRKTIKYIMNTLNIEYPDFFKKYNDKIEAIINKNPKN